MTRGWLIALAGAGARFSASLLVAATAGVESRGRYALMLAAVETSRHLLSAGLGERAIGATDQRGALRRHTMLVCGVAAVGSAAVLASWGQLGSYAVLALLTTATLPVGVISFVLRPLQSAQGRWLHTQVGAATFGVLSLAVLAVGSTIRPVDDTLAFWAITVALAGELLFMVRTTELTTAPRQVGLQSFSFRTAYPIASLASARLDQLVVAPLLGIQALGVYSMALSFHQPQIQLAHVLGSAELHAKVGRVTRFVGLWCGVTATAQVGCVVISRWLLPAGFETLPLVSLALIPASGLLAASIVGSARMIRRQELVTVVEAAWIGALMNLVGLFALLALGPTWTPLAATTIGYTGRAGWLAARRQSSLTAGSGRAAPRQRRAG